MIERGFNSVSVFLSNLSATVLSLLKVALRLRHATRLPVRQKAVCSVLGNGPSLNQSLTEQLELIRETEIVGVNNFAHADAFLQLRPQDYVILDPNYFVFTEQTTDRPDIRKTLTVFLENVDWPMLLYVPHFAKNTYLLRTIAQGNPNIRIVFFNYTVLRGFRWLIYRLYASGYGMPQAQTVIIAALTLMINRRFDLIYLFGADTSWHEEIRLNDQNQLLIKQIHFYDKPKDLTHQPVFADANRQRTFSMSSQFLSLHKAFRGYEVIRDYADFMGVRVVNASAKSYIDAFERPTSTRLQPTTLSQ